MNYLNTEDIIVAQCTSEGHGAINIIRISGDSLAELYLKTVKQNSPPKPNSISVSYTHLTLPTNREV